MDGGKLQAFLRAIGSFDAASVLFTLLRLLGSEAPLLHGNGISTPVSARAHR
jgi:hypothetical protein